MRAPGRAGGGEELGGLRALGFYHRRWAVQADAAVLTRLPLPRLPWENLSQAGPDRDWRRRKHRRAKADLATE